MRPIGNTRELELRAARCGGFSGRVLRRKRERTPRGGHVDAPASVSVTEAIGDAATPEVPRADDARIRQPAGARAPVSPRSPWTTYEHVCPSAHGRPQSLDEAGASWAWARMTGCRPDRA